MAVLPPLQLLPRLTKIKTASESARFTISLG
jgi:hypothetical protein